MTTKPVKFTRYWLTQWISKLPRSFEIHWVSQYLMNIFIWNKELVNIWNDHESQM